MFFQRNPLTVTKLDCCLQAGDRQSLEPGEKCADTQQEANMCLTTVQARLFQSPSIAKQPQGKRPGAIYFVSLLIGWLVLWLVFVLFLRHAHM